jgi:hypothetical protein
MPSNRLAKEIDKLRISLNKTIRHDDKTDTIIVKARVRDILDVTDQLCLMIDAVEELSEAENGSFDPALSSVVERMEELTHWESCPWVSDRSECKCDEISKWDSTLGEAPAGCFP